MNRRQAHRARIVARRSLAYRAWATDTAHGAIPPIAILTDPKLHAIEFARQLRLLTNGAVAAPRAVAAA